MLDKRRREGERACCVVIQDKGEAERGASGSSPKTREIHQVTWPVRLINLITSVFSLHHRPLVGMFPSNDQLQIFIQFSLQQLHLLRLLDSL
jgi:hypothetical protein